MRTTAIQRWASRRVISTLALVLIAPTAEATIYNVNIDTSGFAATSATLAFDFSDGGLPDNTVDLSALTSDGTQGSLVLTGGVSGSGPWTFSDTSFAFSELLVAYSPLGSSLSFTVTTSDNAPLAFPDTFSMSILDASASFSLVTTDAPGGTDALFAIELTGATGQGLTVFTPNETGVSIDVSPVTQVPEPGTIALLFGSAVAVWRAKSRLRAS